LSAGLLGLVLAVGIAPPAEAQEPVPTTLTLVGQKQYADRDTTLLVQLVRDDDGEPVVGAPVLVERRVDGTWQPLSTEMTDDQGQATEPATMARDGGDNVFRATYAGDETLGTQGSESGPVRVPLIRRATRVTVGGPERVVDEKSITLTVRWRTRSGEPVPGTVRLQRRNPGGDWRTVKRLRTGSPRSRLASTVSRPPSWRA
jgi:hypothetical protein